MNVIVGLAGVSLGVWQCPEAMLLLAAGHCVDLLVMLPELLLSKSVTPHVLESRLWPNSSHMASSREERHRGKDLEAGAHAITSVIFPFLVLVFHPAATAWLLHFPQEGPVVTKTINFASAASKPHWTPKLSPCD